MRTAPGRRLGTGAAKRAAALDRSRGEELWRFDTATPWGSAPVPGPGVVVFTSADGFLTALD